MKDYASHKTLLKNEKVKAAEKIESDRKKEELKQQLLESSNRASRLSAGRGATTSMPPLYKIGQDEFETVCVVSNPTAAILAQA